MNMNMILSNTMELDNPSEKIISILSIGFVTLLVLLILSLVKAYKLKSKHEEEEI